jgi:hypothetical protein
VNKRALFIFAASLLLGLQFAQAMTAMPRLSITYDEDVHLSTGYSIWRTGDDRLVEDHPPLLELWMSWPLLLSPEIPHPTAVPTWPTGDRRLFVRNATWWAIPIDHWLMPARLTIPWLMLILSALLFRWAAEWFGPRAGLFILALFAFDPNVLAHGNLATLDLGVTTGIFATMYLVQRCLRRPRLADFALAGAVLGLTLGAKISALLLLPITVGLMALWGARRREWPVIIKGIAIYLGIGFLVLWAGHRFAIGQVAGMSFPAPMPTYWRSIFRVQDHVTVGDWTYLLGETYRGGRWYFFPIVLALKTPLPALLLLATSLAGLWLATQCGHGETLARTYSGRRGLILWSFPLTYFAISVMGEINLGYRHLLPMLPFCYLGLGYGVALISRWRIRRMLYAAGALLLIWQAVGTVAVWPFHLTYSNEVAGGPRNTWRHMADSNVDWGQGLKALRDYLAAHDLAASEVKLSPFVFFIDPALYGIEATPLPPHPEAPAALPARFNPAPGTYILSASTLRGLQVADDSSYRWFWQREPDDIVANAFLVYEVTERTPSPGWVGQCTQPGVPLSDELIAERFGREDVRRFAFDCTQSWLYPAGATSAGWYVLHREVAMEAMGTKEASPFIAERLAFARRSFEQRRPGVTPPLTVFAWEPSPVAPKLAVAVAEVEGAALALPIATDGPLTLVRAMLAREEGALVFTGFWRVTSPPARAFSLMAHLVNREGQGVAVGDGLGLSWSQLQTGDLLVQRHHLPLPAEGKQDGAAYWIRTGGYWLETLDTMERWPVLQDGQPVGDYILFKVKN